MKINIMEAFLKDTQRIFISGKSKVYLCITFKQPLGKFTCAVWGPLELFQMSGKLTRPGRAGERLDRDG